MVEYRIYDESKLDAQIELVQEVIKDWEWVIWYPNKESLKESYSRENFTADTRHYAYDGEKLVGFLSSTVEKEIDGVLWGSIHIPLVRKGNEAIEDELVKKAVEHLKSPGVKIIRTIAMPGWGDTIKILERNGFGERTLLSYTTLFPVKSLVKKNYQKPTYLREIITPDDNQKFNDMMIATSSRSEEAIKAYINGLIENESLLLRILAMKKDTFGYGYLMKGHGYLELPGRVFFMMSLDSRMHIDAAAEFIYDLFQYTAIKALESGYDTLWHEVTNIDLIDAYRKLNAKFDPCYRYVLKIE